MRDEIILPDTYFHNLACGNCNVTEGLKIPLGIPISEFIKTHTCKNCGCMLGDTGRRHYAQNIPIYLPYGGFR